MSTPPAPVPMPETPGSPEEHPVAEVRPSGAARPLWPRIQSRLWWLTAVSLVVAIVLFISAFRHRGPRITVHFRQGFGIKPGDRLRYRGIEVGEVTAVSVDRELRGIDVHLELVREATRLAREGSRFWIERPRLSLSRMSGLETVVGAKFLAVLPGAVDGARATHFEGIESPLTIIDSEVVEILIRFRDGHGLDVGDPVKYRGIMIGEVVAVELNPDLDGVNVRVRLIESARTLARAGSQFWIERPKVSLTSVRGLDTLVGGRYLAVLPGPGKAEPLAVFDGLEAPPPTEERLEGGLEIVLEGDLRYGLEVGAPVRYRGLTVGHVVAVGLANDAAHVETRVYLQPAYKQLVRDNSQFWSTSGIDVSFGLSGLQLNAENLETIAAGGMAFATPTQPGRSVSTGHRFTLHKKPENEWLEWRAHLLVGDAQLSPGVSLPQPLRVAVRWREKLLGFERDRQRQGWVIVLQDDRLLGPADLLLPIEGSVRNETTLEIGGQSLQLVADQGHRSGGLAVYSLPAEFARTVRAERWPLDKIKPDASPQDCLATTGPQDMNFDLPASRLRRSDQGWLVDPSRSLNADAHGACVVLPNDGVLAGIMLWENGKARIVPVSPSLLP